MDGWIKLHRKFLDWQWYGNPVVKDVFIHLLLSANIENKKWQGIDIKRGQVVTSIGKISQATGHSVQQVRTAIKKLKSTECITQSATPKFTVFTVINYDNYQEATRSATNEQQTTNKQLTNEQQTTNNNIRKKEYKKERRKEELPPLPPEGNSAAAKSKPVKEKFAEFVSMTNDEYSSLVAKVGEQGTKRCIEILDNYKGSSGKKYSSDYRAILNWVIGRYEGELEKHGIRTQVKPKAEPNTGNPFLEMLKEIEESEGNTVDIGGNVTGNGNS